MGAIDLVRIVDPEQPGVLKAINSLLDQERWDRSKPFRPRTKKQLFQTIIGANNYLVMAFERGVAYVGMGTICFFRPPGGWCAEIHDVVVDEHHRGRKIGARISLDLLSRAQAVADK